MTAASLSLLLLAGVEMLPAFAAPAQPPACAAPEYRQFDFWLGDWDAFDIANPSTPVARNEVTRILDGCALLEDYRGTNGSHGESFSIYDASRKVWHQSWVTNRGKLLVIEGGLRDGAMLLTGADRDATGKQQIVRGVWKPVSGGVRETAFTSIDNGKTWKLWFDIVFKPHQQ